MFAAFGIFCGNGIAAVDLFKMMFASFAVNMTGFLLIYVVMVIAVLQESFIDPGEASCTDICRRSPC